MRELTEEQKLRLYSKPEISEKDQINNAINGYTRIINEANLFIKGLEQSKEVRVEFNYIGIHKKDIIVKMYKVLITDWKKELKKAELELKELTNGK